jgi:hypothetical protein
MLTKDMIILDIVERYESTQDVFHAYDSITGSCIMCEQLFATLAKMSEYYGIDTEKLLAELNRAIGNETT